MVEAEGRCVLSRISPGGNGKASLKIVS
jgi:hypothetical protein